MCDAAACAAMSAGPAQVAVEALNELRAALAAYAPASPDAGASAPSDAEEAVDGASVPNTTGADSTSRQLRLLPRPGHEALAAVRARLDTRGGRRLYAQRRGIEGTISQGVRAFGLRRARYRGLAKAGLQSVATAAAINLDRLGAWSTQRPLAPTRASRSAVLAA